MVNYVHIMGRLTRDPEIRYTQSNIPVANMTIAVDRDYKNANGERIADFHYVVAWRKKAEFATKYYTKGQLIYLVGSLENRSYVDKDGNQRTVTEIIARDFYFTGDKRQQEPRPSNNYEPPVTAGDFHDIDDDGEELPF